MGKGTKSAAGMISADFGSDCWILRFSRVFLKTYFTLLGFLYLSDQLKGPPTRGF